MSSPHLFFFLDVVGTVKVNCFSWLIQSAAGALGGRTVDGTRMMLRQFCGQIELYMADTKRHMEAMSAALLEEIERVSA
jgi:shikimate dehydrogenase